MPSVNDETRTSIYKHPLSKQLRTETAQRWLTAAWAPTSAAILAGLLCTGCPVGADLDTDYQEYIVQDQSTVPSTTGAPTGCDDAAVDVVFTAKCSSSICHGTPGMATPGITSGLDLFSPDRNTALLDKASADSTCAELVIDSATPGQSLMLQN